ncbi:uncharacterized protein LOC122504805 [Leptopilina heterotoma]|uniref:uncharacterized protein LOC122504805 n=1 Tax=Leptopilina heterotoma TaxID=63436 RepID=UPI001CA7FC09|nr:uncharacterized protein LOC122504805 [Leptopilina heterotoma]
MQVDAEENLFNEVLIQLVAEKPFLHNKTYRTYQDNCKRRDAWHEIATNVYLATNIETSAEKVQNKWEKLRTLYDKEAAIRNSYTPSGSAAPEETGLRFEYFEAMKYLNKSPKSSVSFSSYRKPKNHISAKVNETDDASMSNETLEIVEDLENDESEVVELSDVDVNATDLSVEKIARKKEADNDFYEVIERSFIKVPENKQRECFFAVKRLIRNVKEQRPKN